MFIFTASKWLVHRGVWINPSNSTTLSCLSKDMMLSSLLFSWWSGGLSACYPTLIPWFRLTVLLLLPAAYLNSGLVPWLPHVMMDIQITTPPVHNHVFSLKIPRDAHPAWHASLQSSYVPTWSESHCFIKSVLDSSLSHAVVITSCRTSGEQ